MNNIHNIRSSFSNAVELKDLSSLDGVQSLAESFSGLSVLKIYKSYSPYIRRRLVYHAIMNIQSLYNYQIVESQEEARQIMEKMYADRLEELGIADRQAKKLRL